MRSIKIQRTSGSREAERIPSKACSETAIQSEVKATQRTSKQKGPIKKKKRGENREKGEGSTKPYASS
jgi:hypothetical protein